MWERVVWGRKGKGREGTGREGGRKEGGDGGSKEGRVLKVKVGGGVCCLERLLCCLGDLKFVEVLERVVCGVRRKEGKGRGEKGGRGCWK